MNDSEAREMEERWARTAELMRSGIRVQVSNREYFTKVVNTKFPDTYHWKAGPEIRSFYDKMGLKVLSCQANDGGTEFFFPQDRKDAALLFKLKFANG